MASAVGNLPTNAEEPTVGATATKAAPSSRMPPKKRISRRHQDAKHRLLHRRQGSSSLEPKHREYKKYGHIQRVNFCLFLRILMRHLLVEDKELHAQARKMVQECLKTQRAGGLQGTPLMSALKGRLYGLVGRDLWDESERYLHTYQDLHNISIEL